MRGRYVLTNGVRLWCLESGPADGPLVLLMPRVPGARVLVAHTRSGRWAPRAFT